MKLITQFELSNRSEGELRYLFGIVNHTLVQSREGSPKRRNALASLENISQALSQKKLSGPSF